jgi:hypothetical protein
VNLPRDNVPAAVGIGRAEPDHRFDRWAASYEQLPFADAVFDLVAVTLPEGWPR